MHAKYAYIHQNQKENAQKAGPMYEEERTSENNHNNQPGLFPLKLGGTVLIVKGKSPSPGALGTRLKLTTQRSHDTRKL